MNKKFSDTGICYAYQLRFHLGFRTHKNQVLFRGADEQKNIELILRDVCGKANYHLLEMRVFHDRVNLLVSLKPDISPAVAVGTLKCNSSRIWNKSPKPQLRWSGGYFFRSVGSVTADTVFQYLGKQEDRHKHEAKLLASFCNPDFIAQMQDQVYSHSCGQYLLHVVMSPQHHRLAFDTEISNVLEQQLLASTLDMGGELIRASILENHLHSLVQLPPHCAPAEFCRAYREHAEQIVMQKYVSWFLALGLDRLWSDSLYVGTVGTVTSKDVGLFLNRGGDE